MFWRILKKDLKRKKTMNIILLLFIALSAMFAAASVNNILAVTGGLDNYFDKAGIPDYFIITRDGSGESAISQHLDKSSCIEGYGAEKDIFASADNYKKNGEKFMDFSVISLVTDFSEARMKFFDEDNEVITDVDKGKVYITGNVPRRSGVKAGDKFTFTLGDTEMELEVAGIAKDALLGSDMMGNPRMLMNSEDYAVLCQDETISNFCMGHIYYIETDDIKSLESELSGMTGMLFNAGRDTVKMTYFMNMLVAVIILIVSVGLLIVSFVVLRFTIRFTISEEFREIGVMKAIGLRNGGIRVLYLVKYFGIAVVGAAIGFFGSLPFGKMLLKSVSENMMLGNDNDLLISILCSGAVVLIIMLFGWGSTGRVKKLSPIDAVRDGQTGERFGKRGLMSLGKSRLGSTGFLAANDVVSESKQYGLLTAIFAICTSLVMILAVTANTIDSDSLLYLLSVRKSDVYLNDTARVMDIMAGIKTIDEAEEEIEEILADNGMPGEVFIEAWYRLPVKAEGKDHTLTFMKCDHTKTTDYEYTKGTAPEKEDEIAITKISADKMGVSIGDSLTVDIGGEEREYIITAYFQSFSNLGECARFHETVEVPDTLMTNAFAFQIDFDDDPDAKETEKRIERMKDIFDNDNIMDPREFVKDCMGVGDTIKSVKDLVLMISIIIIILLTVLMERSFISKQKSEIALMKAVGFSSGSVILHHTLRFGITVLAAVLISSALFLPLTKLVMAPIFAMTGAVGRIDYVIDPLEIFGLYPLIILAVTVLSTALTALYTKTIKASDTASIE